MIARYHSWRPPLPQHFNMVTDVVIWNWVTLVVGEETVQDGFRRAVQCLMAFFYMGDRLLDSPHPAHI